MQIHTHVNASVAGQVRNESTDTVSLQRTRRSRSATPVGATDEEIQLAKHTVVEQKSKCSEAGIDVKGLKTKTELINALCEALLPQLF